MVWPKTRPTAPCAAGAPGSMLVAPAIRLAKDASSLPQSAPVTSVRTSASMPNATNRRQGGATVIPAVPCAAPVAGALTARSA